ncbi:conserved hypothetical protein [Vibrio nigripulchritudo SFn27]|uniref:DNA phosphorothioation-associated methyltransferase n=1 Tax=Vibrio nigripulchritudo TaxID=28173 RepID=U4KCX4_9VIBR|nr:DNA phosphorothioation-associated putative methyltransferase [Vibrio nigripulchritudo]CCN82727.1 conserved hypothetical protein [Vibrio nigripulchritudo BLFn1]CCN89877.1 conserved hypothetical protein [Vibrio nigripulchritudo SFn27]CCN92274.1 conserved hypothetical protein [Vibrio nigripulchritudo ENn2]CCO43761.1 conserved hypothetical protein [Vibrio nigripulchritudo SFn135]CCO53075.1 conserved hypothetical protein [Vibrio nigripulchritudo Wn13]
MDFQEFKAQVKNVSVGKQLPDAVYFHRDAIASIPSVLQKFIPAVAKAVNLPDEEWNLVKLFKNEFRLSLLYYPDFYIDSYPALVQSLNVDLSKLSHKVTCYRASENPPILHRKETMLAPDSEYVTLFREITEEGERAGLYENTRTIGFKRSWLNLIAKKGFKLIEGRLHRTDIDTEEQPEVGIDRHRTAIVRHELSAPMKLLAKSGFLDGSYSIFDYGSGRGDDLRELEAHGLDVLGWDPNFQPDNEKIQSDVVNLGFVLNVIEDQDERLEAILNAWDLAEKVLIVSVMLANDKYISQFKPYKDGVITTRNTFQKYYAQSEIKTYIEHSLQEDAIAAGPGIFYVFRDKLEEQIYLQNKYKRTNTWQQLTSPKPVEDKAKLVITQNSNLFESFWNQCLELGRIPANDEFSQSKQVRQLVGSHKKVFSLLREMYDMSEFERAVKVKKEDLLLYFTMGLFEKRKPYTQQSKHIKRDIKALFEEYNTVINLATELLFSIADTDLIEKQCVKAQSLLPASLHSVGHSLIFHKEYLDELPLLLRVYVGSALQLYGELDENVDLIKIHTTSGKLTLLYYDDYMSSVPMLVKRIKIKMADQDISFFEYVDESRRPPLLNKHLLMSEEHELYNKQLSFDKRLAKLCGIQNTIEAVFHRSAFEQVLSENNKKISGYRIVNI